MLYPIGISSECSLIWKASWVAEWPVWWVFWGVLGVYVPGECDVLCILWFGNRRTNLRSARLLMWTLSNEGISGKVGLIIYRELHTLYTYDCAEEEGYEGQRG